MIINSVNCVFSNVVSRLKRFLLIDELNLQAAEPTIWKMSVLRIILASGLLLTSAIVLHSSYQAYQQGLYYVIALTAGFSLLLWSTLSLRKKQLRAASASLVLTIVLAGLCILFFTLDIASARYGLLFFFTLPIVLRLFYGNRVAIIGIVLNLVPYFLLVRNQPVAPLFGIDITLPETHTYLSSLVFLFFNICLPFAVIRVMSSLERQATLNQQQSQKLNKLVNRYQEIFNNGGTPSFFCDQQGKILQANRSARQLIKSYAPSCQYIQHLFEIKAPLSAGVKQQAHIVNNDNCVFEIQLASLLHHKKQLIHCFDVSSTTAKVKKFDAFKRQQYEKHYIDSLTGLKNHHFWKYSESAESLSFSNCVLLKLANLKEINLQYGHAQGDKVLAQAATLLESTLPSDVQLYHFPGAKFLLCSKSNRADFCTWLWQELPQYMQQSMASSSRFLPLIWRGGHTKVTRIKAIESIIESCSIALTQTSSDLPIFTFDSNTVKSIREHTQRKDRIKQLLEDGHLSLHLQPQVSMEETIIGFECLARLKEPNTGNILQPYQFIPIVEENNWHVLLTQKVVEGAIHLLEHWPSAMPKVPLAINLSGPELLNDVFYEKLLRRYSESPTLCAYLKLELTETSVLASHLDTKRRLTTLANIGATIIIDDFGTGHASLAQLIDISASVLKVDREFVDKIETSERHRKIVKMTLELARSLNMQTIAEGVETQAQLLVLKGMGFTLFQGYLYGKPGPIEQWQNQASPAEPTLVHENTLS
tara:strand:- start:45 stop:2327 length:2283 start_codon:yes stop_codon:yes gene_type:complete